MREIKISDSELGEANIRYLYDALYGALSDFNGGIEAKTDEHRSVLTLSCEKQYSDFIRCEAEDKIAEIIAVKYKYEYFKKTVKPIGLNAFEQELLIDALISADIDDDKKYIVRKLKHFSEYAIDGVFNFRLIPLKRKWEEIAGYIPPYFSGERLKDFISFLLTEKRGKTAIIENGIVYDQRFIPLNRTALIGQTGEGRIIKETILSGCGEVKVLCSLPELDEKYLKMYFG